MRIHPLVVARIRKAHADALVEAEQLSSLRAMLPRTPEFHNQELSLNKELHEANAIAQSWEAMLNEAQSALMDPDGKDIPA